jgi:NAD(P)-dependent dehydrogenase (short-subunit alcohol dehydrogenase family)
MDLNGKVALITGGARRVGRSISTALANAGCHLAIHYHQSAQEAADLVQAAREMGLRADSAQADLRQPGEIDALFAAIERKFGQLDILVNSAAEMQVQDLLAASVDEWEQAMDLNLRAPFLCVQHAARLMNAQGGNIVNVSDIGARKTWTRFPLYSISKAGLEMLTRLAARALGPSIRVNAVAPGLVLRSPETDPEQWERLYQALPLGRPGTPEDVARAVVFLCRNDFITGETITVDGGRQLI